MKKLIILILACLGQAMQAQVIKTDTVYESGVPMLITHYAYEEINPSPFHKDDYVVDLSFGGPYSPWGIWSPRGVNAYSTPAAEIWNTHYLCAGIGYQLNKEYSVGMELTFASMHYSYKTTLPSYTNTPVTTTHTGTYNQIRLLAKMSYHFNISERFDAFLTGGFGYQSSRSAESPNKVPVTVRAGVGGRFFLTKNFALHAQAGLGGPLMQIGFSRKFDGPVSKRRKMLQQR